MTITITKKNCPSELDLYNLICKKLGHKGQFGNNLDALHDLLTEPRPKFRIYIKDADFSKAYGGRGEIILALMKDAQDEGGSFSLKTRIINHR